MRLKLLLVTTVAIVAFYAVLVLGAQSPPPMLAWDAPSNSTSAAQAQGLTYTLYVNGGPGVAVPGVVCTGTAAPFPCTAPVPSGVPVAIDTKLELTAKTATSEESARSVPFFRPPTVPTRLRLP